MSPLQAYVAACPGCVPHRDPSSLDSPYVRCIRNVLGELTGLGLVAAFYLRFGSIQILKS
jgi:hypothetical protein